MASWHEGPRAGRRLIEADRQRHGTVAGAERERYGSIAELRREVAESRRALVAEAADRLRTLATIMDEVALIDAHGGVAGFEALAEVVHSHLRGAEGDATRGLAERIEALA